MSICQFAFIVAAVAVHYLRAKYLMQRTLQTRISPIILIHFKFSENIFQMV